MNKFLSIGIIILFLGLSISSSTGFNTEQLVQPISSGNTLYVGGNGTGNYTKIQDAIDNASEGDTVFVYNGTYYENVIVDKSINILGENRNITTIDGRGKDVVIKIFSDQTDISGFTLENGDNAGFEINSNYSFISDNNITSNNGIGIFFGISVNNNTIKNNIISSNTEHGIYSNFFNYNHIISNNKIISNERCGIYGDSSYNHNITGNIIISNRINGILFYYGGGNHIITANKIESNGWGISTCWSYNITIVGNNISFNRNSGIQFYDSSGNFIINNNIQGNDEYGLFLQDGSHRNIVKNNNFINNKKNAYYQLSLINKWNENYWDDWIGLEVIFLRFIPYRILGGLFSLNFDWHPAQKPFEI